MMHKEKHIVYLIKSFISMTCLIYSSMASQKPIKNFQCPFTDQQGSPLDRTYDIIFGFYASDLNSGLLCTEENHTGVNVFNKLANVLLGSITSFDKPQAVMTYPDRYTLFSVTTQYPVE